MLGDFIDARTAGLSSSIVPLVRRLESAFSSRRRDGTTAMQDQSFFVSFYSSTMPPKIARLISPQYSIPLPPAHQLLQLSSYNLITNLSLNPSKFKSNAPNQNANNHSPRLARHSLLHLLLRHRRYNLPDCPSSPYATPKAVATPAERCHVPTHASEPSSDSSQSYG